MGSRSLVRRRYGQPDMVKQRPGSNIPMLIDLPSQFGQFSQGILRQHLPKFFYDLRQSGNRIARPLEHFSSTFRRINDRQNYSFALDWVFDRVDLYRSYPRALHPLYNNLDPGNQMGRLLQTISTAYMTGDMNTYYTSINDAFEVIKAISEIIRPDSGFDYSDRLFMEYLQTVQSFIPYFNDADPSMSGTFDILQAVYDAGLQDITPIAILAQGIPPNDQLQLDNAISIELATNGNFRILALDMRANNIP